MSPHEHRPTLDAEAKRVTECMELWVDAVMDHVMSGAPNLSTVNQIENELAMAYNHFGNSVARVLHGMDNPISLDS
jgi:hypothetical protein